MSHNDEIPAPPRTEVSRLTKDAVGLARKLEGAVPQGAAPVVSLRLSEKIVRTMRLPASAAGVLSRALVPVIGDDVDGRKLFRIALMVLANRDVLSVCGDIQKAASDETNKPHWSVVQITDVLSSGYTRAGRHLWGVWGFHIWGPLAGRDFMFKASDAYLCGIVRDVSGAKWSKIVAPVDLSLMRLRLFLEGEGIRRVDNEWAAGRKWNGDIRKEREGCPKGPCERCRKTRTECPVSPYATRKELEK